MITNTMTRNTAQITHIETLRDHLIVQAHFAETDPDTMFTYWTEPDLLCRWWSDYARVDLRPGGTYKLLWRGSAWNLLGQFTMVESGRQLGFTWRWAHEPEQAEKHVAVVFKASELSGTLVTITQQSYSESEADQEDRIGHLEGWNYFLTRLGQAL